MQWRRQGSAILRVVLLRDGRKGIAVLVGSNEKKQNSVVVFQRDNGEREIVAITDLLDVLSPEDIIDIYCTQERVFGKRAFAPLEIK
ncbi:MAG: hypothetical protein N3G21_08325 [Candidatus Hydrogenedentes bacterium]|nr:hypothetical protein [Candidatus Hydrogenedentota bacterium]